MSTAEHYSFASASALPAPQPQDGLTLARLTKNYHAAEVLGLFQREQHYITMETGTPPDLEFVNGFFDLAPPGLTSRDMMHLGLRFRNQLIGAVGIAKGYEFPEDWWVGLMLVDPGLRSQGIGTSLFYEIVELAQAEQRDVLKLSVLAANPRAMAFWQKLGFEWHRDAPATPDSDGHDRVVLKYRL